MKNLNNLSEEEATAMLFQATDGGGEAWQIHFIKQRGVLRLDENHPILCDGLNLQLFAKVKSHYPTCPVPEYKVIGTFGDDDFAWVCQHQDGKVVELDEYDLKNGADIEAGVVFPSLAHYLLFVAYEQD